MAEKDYALEMWRLLDRGSNLINPRELLDRIMCVKSGSLCSMFQDGNCHPKMALANNAIPVLCVAINVACNVRGGFLNFDEGLMQRISEVAYEDDIKDLPAVPDVSNYLVSGVILEDRLECFHWFYDDPLASNGNKDSVGFDGKADAEVERRLNTTIQGSSMPLPTQQLRQAAKQLRAPSVGHGQAKKALHSSPAMEEDEPPRQDHLRLYESLPDFRSISGKNSSVAQLSSSNKDPDLKAGQIDPSCLTSAGAVQEIAFKSGTKVEFKQTLVSSSELQFIMEVVFAGQKIGEGIDRTRREAQHHAAEGSLFYLAGEGDQFMVPCPEMGGIQLGNILVIDVSIIPLYLLFHLLLLSGKGLRTWVLQHVNKYLSQFNPDSSNMPRDGISLGKLKDNYLRDDMSRKAAPSRASASPRIIGLRIEAPKKPTKSIFALKELCMMEGFTVAYQTRPQFLAGQKNDVYAEVEVDAGVRRRIGRIQGCIVMLVAISNSNDEEASNDARMLLNFMSNNTQYALHMAEAGYFKPLLKYLKQGSEMSKVLMETALSRLELTDQNKASLGEEGVVQPLVSMFKTGNLEAKLSALNALKSLSNSKENIQRLMDS
ncbi:hypothetical protein OROMI_008107 [Orobanche minor]